MRPGRENRTPKLSLGVGHRLFSRSGTGHGSLKMGDQLEHIVLYPLTYKVAAGIRDKKITKFAWYACIKVLADLVWESFFWLKKLSKEKFVSLIISFGREQFY